MKKLLAVVVQFVLFLVLDAFGLFYHPFGVRTKLAGSSTEARMYVWDGILLMLAGYIVLLLIAALRKRIGMSWPWATLALLLAAIAGFKLGFVTQNW